jgi:hypothetical protein
MRRVSLLRFSRNVVVGLALLAAMWAIPAQAATVSKSTSPVFAFGQPTEINIPGAASTLLRGSDSVTLTMHTSQLAPGHVVTAWWIIFNAPQNCAFPVYSYECGPGDVTGSPAALPAVMFASGRVVASDGTATFAARLKVGDGSGCVTIPIDVNTSGSALYPCNPLVSTVGPHVHVLLLDHGPAIPGLISQQLHVYGAGCNNFGLDNGPNTCALVQATVHQS